MDDEHPKRGPLSPKTLKRLADAVENGLRPPYSGMRTGETVADIPLATVNAQGKAVLATVRADGTTLSVSEKGGQDASDISKRLETKNDEKKRL